MYSTTAFSTHWNSRVYQSKSIRKQKWRLAGLRLCFCQDESLLNLCLHHPPGAVLRAAAAAGEPAGACVDGTCNCNFICIVLTNLGSLISCFLPKVAVPFVLYIVMSRSLKPSLPRLDTKPCPDVDSCSRQRGLKHTLRGIYLGLNVKVSPH